MNSKKNTIKSALKDEITCAVCQEIYDKPQALLPCLHTFCLDCVNFIPGNNYENRIICPICRNRSTGHVANFTIQSFIDIFNNANLREEEQEEQQRIAAVTETDVEATNIIERVHISDTHPNYGPPSTSTSGELSFSSPASSSSFRSYTRITPCRSCEINNDTNFHCLMPIQGNDTNEEIYGHILCDFCSEYMPARGKDGTEPALDQCCSFCGLIACDAYWGCANISDVAKLHTLNDIPNVDVQLLMIDAIDSKEDGHLNKMEVEALFRHLSETETTLDEAWQMCLLDINENHFRTPILTKMTATAHEVYNTRRVPKYSDALGVGASSNSDDGNEDDDEEDYFDQITEKGVFPSQHLRACTYCLPAIVNGQFYGYWKNAIENGLTDETREICAQGIKCTAQWNSDTHASRLSHIETENFFM